jgi:Holliday junction DNA helicase RuvA
MIAYIKGTLVKLKTTSILVDVANIGYEVFVPISMIANCPSMGEELMVHTYQYVREDVLVLYGFMTDEDLEVFKKLITVNGIGPKGALALLSTITVDELKFALMTEDDTIITKTPGIGKKTAQRLIIDLKDKLDLASLTVPDGLEVSSILQGEQVNARQEAVEALVSLGYSNHEALQTVKKVKSFNNVEDIISQALKQFAIL